MDGWWGGGRGVTYYSLNRLLASIYIVSEEQVIRFWGKPCKLEQPQQVIILPVHIPYYLDGRRQL